MTLERLGDLRRWAEETLRRARVDTPALDARVLLLACARIDHATLVADPEREVEAHGFRAAIARRAMREPVSRILGRREFHGLSFKLTPAVLDPRPDTETLVDAALALPWTRLLDLGTGSGAIAVALLHARHDATGVATDLSADALAIAAENAHRHGVADRLTFVESAWFACVDGQFDLAVSNPPYILESQIATLAPEVRSHDPLPALSGGADGLEAYRAIASGLAAHLAPNGKALLEIGSGQAEAVTAIFTARKFRLSGSYKDLSQTVRVLEFAPE